MIRYPACLSFSRILLFLVLYTGCASKPNPSPPQATSSGGDRTVPKQPAPSDKNGIAATHPPPTLPPGQPGPKPIRRIPVPQVPLTETSAVDPEVAWYGKLKNGLLKQQVPPTMQWKVPSTVTVVVGGEKADTSSALPSATGSSPIKVSRQMKVMVTCPDNPDEFTIAAEPGTTDVQYVPEDGTTTWNYSVTPRYTGKNQKIAIRAWVVYPGATSADRELPVYTAEVNVRVPSLGECIKRLVEGDPDYWVKYGLPGGAGFAFLSGIVAGIWKWRQKKKTNGTTPEPVGP